MHINHTGMCRLFNVFIVSHVGCWLGDPNGKKVWIPGGDAKKVLAAEVVSDNPAKLALALMCVFFTEQEMASSNCTPAPSRQLLNPNIISGIQSKIHSIDRIRHIVTICNIRAHQVQISPHWGGTMAEDTPHKHEFKVQEPKK